LRFAPAAEAHIVKARWSWGLSFMLLASSARAAEPDKRDQARAAFEQGVAHFDRGEWSAALADFMHSRSLFPTKSATINASVCLRKEGRYDEAMELTEELLRTYPDLPPADRATAERQLNELRPVVGSIEIAGGEPGAQIVIDGRERGLIPPSAPLRVSAGTHVVRIFKDGFVPIERRVDVAGRQTVTFDARLSPLVEGGQLVVTEGEGRALDVIIDGILVGKTPYQGRFSRGRHTVSLRGEGELGAPPVDATVGASGVTRLTLAAEALDASLRVMPTPANAVVAIDGVQVGNGVWEGRLRSGAHRVEVGADGFLPATRQVELQKGERSSVSVELERDVSSPTFRAANPPRVFVELDVGAGIGLAFGGDVRAACNGDCSASPPFALGATVHGGYQFPSGLTLGLDAGVLAMSAGVSGRNTELFPRGLAPNRGTVDDDLYLRGFRVGPSLGYRFGTAALPLTVRFGAGMFFGSAGDNRTGTFTTTSGAPYSVASSESSGATYAWAAPEFRAGIPFARHFEVGLGLTVLVMAALDTPQWSDKNVVLAAPAGQRGDGLATFGSASMTGTFVVSASPSVGLRASF
jgi:tetratricopeptide (TPR) repeat protein